METVTNVTTRESIAMRAAISQLRARPLRWLVTGSAGFIGSHLVEALLRWTAILTKRSEAVLHETPYVATQWIAGAEGD